jgi:hypothetical protein
MRRECINLRNDSNAAEQCEHRKLITDVETRWNSTMFLIKSVLQMKPALDSLREGVYEETDKTDGKLKSMIPSPMTFEIIEQILPLMEKCATLSEILSGDLKPTMHLVNIKIFVYDLIRTSHFC